MSLVGKIFSKITKEITNFTIKCLQTDWTICATQAHDKSICNVINFVIFLMSLNN